MRDFIGDMGTYFYFQIANALTNASASADESFGSVFDTNSNSLPIAM
jgi:hypothetical protein